MKIRMRVDVSGRGPGGRRWPARGGVVEVPDAEGAKMCASGMAEPVHMATAGGAVETRPAPMAGVETRPGTPGDDAAPDPPPPARKPTARKTTAKKAASRPPKAE